MIVIPSKQQETVAGKDILNKDGTKERYMAHSTVAFLVFIGSQSQQRFQHSSKSLSKFLQSIAFKMSWLITEWLLYSPNAQHPPHRPYRALPHTEDGNRKKAERRNPLRVLPCAVRRMYIILAVIGARGQQPMAVSSERSNNDEARAQTVGRKVLSDPPRRVVDANEPKTCTDIVS